MMPEDGDSESQWIVVLVIEYAQAFPFVWILILLMILDVATGIIAAAINREVDSNCSFIGALKKAQMLLMVAAGLVFELIYPEFPWGRLIAGLLSLGEMFSIVENAGKAGVPIPEQLRDMLRRLRTAEKEDASTTPKVNIEFHTDHVPKQPDPAEPADGKQALP